MEIFVRNEPLPHDSAADQFAVSLNQLTVGSVMKQGLSEKHNHNRVNDAQQDCRRDRHQSSNQKIPFHKYLLREPDAGNQHIDQLDSDERDDYAAHAVDHQVIAQQYRSAHGPILDPAQRQRNQRNDDQRVEDHR